MRILQIVHDYPYTNLYKRLFQSLPDDVYSKAIVTLSPADNYDSDNEDVVVLRCLRSGHFSFWYNQKPRYKDSLEKIKPKEFDISHAHFLFEDGELAYRYKKVYKIPYIVAIRSSCLSELNSKMKVHHYIHGLKLLNKADAIVFLSPIYKKRIMELPAPSRFKRLIQNKAFVIPNGIDKYWHDNVWEEVRSLDSAKIIILTVATIEKNKNQTAVAKAIEILREKGFCVQYRVVGKILDFEMYNELMKYPFVEYFEEMPKEELVKQYRTADIFVLPSFVETFGLVYAEAMTQGLPVIYSRGQGFDEQFDEGIVGYSVDAGSPFEISEGIEKVTQNYNNLSKAAPALARKFDWTSIAAEYKLLYENIVKKRNE